MPVEREMRVVIRAKEAFHKVMTLAQRSAHKVGRAWTAMGKIFRKIRKIALLTAAAIAGLGFGLFKLVSSTAKAGDSIHKMSVRIGASTQALSEYLHVAELSGVKVEALTIGWQRQTRRIAEAAKGMGEARGALKELGLEATELVRLRPEEQFEAIAGAIDKIEDPAHRVRLAMKLWDSEGVSLLQMLEKGTEGIEEMRAQARALGITFDDVAAKRSAGFVDAMTRLKSGFRGIFNVVGKELIPIFTLWATTATDKIKELLADGTVDRWAKQILGAVEKIGKGIRIAGKAFGIFIRFFGVETRSALEVVNTEIERMEKAQRAGIIRLNDASVAARIYNDLLAERNRLENDGLEIQKKKHVITITSPGGGESPRLMALRADLDAEFQIWEFFSNRKQRLSEQETIALQANAQGHMMLERFRSSVVGRAYRGMEDAMLGLLDTGRLSVRVFAKVVADQVKIELLGIAIRSGVQGVYQYARGLAAAATFNPMAAVHFASSKTFFKTAALAGAGAVAAHGIGGAIGVGGATERSAPGTVGGEPINTVSAFAGEQAPQAQQITLNIYNPLSEQNWAEIAENNIIPALNDAGDRNVKLNINVIDGVAAA